VYVYRLCYSLYAVFFFSIDCVISFRDATHVTTEGDTLTITVQVSNPPSSDISVEVMGPMPPPIMVTIPAGATSATFEFPTSEDNICEDDETFTLTLDASSLPDDCTVGDPASTTVTVEDDDGKLVLGFCDSQVYSLQDPTPAASNFTNMSWLCCVY